LYIDEDDQIRDRHIEHLFEDCFYGRALDDIFINNFRLYFEACAARFLPDPAMPTSDVFTDAATARAWVTMNFGLVYVGSFKQTDPLYSDETYVHCSYMAKLRTRVAGNVDEACYAPTALHAILLTVVNVFRHVCHDYHEDIINNR
jgi:hypothetical protein